MSIVFVTVGDFPTADEDKAVVVIARLLSLSLPPFLACKNRTRRRAISAATVLCFSTGLLGEATNDRPQKGELGGGARSVVFWGVPNSSNRYNSQSSTVQYTDASTQSNRDQEL